MGDWGNSGGSMLFLALKATPLEDEGEQHAAKEDAWDNDARFVTNIQSRFIVTRDYFKNEPNAHKHAQDSQRTLHSERRTPEPLYETRRAVLEDKLFLLPLSLALAGKAHPLQSHLAQLCARFCDALLLCHLRGAGEEKRRKVGL